MQSMYKRILVGNTNVQLVSLVNSENDKFTVTQPLKTVKG